MGHKFTARQLEALQHRQGNILVNASAGSGKTSVLSERVCQLILEGISPKRILVVTFTRAAAKEMKERIRQRLIEEKVEAQVLLDFSEANFQTFDSYYQYLVKKYSYELGIDPDFTVLDPYLSTIYFAEQIRSTLNLYLTNAYPNRSSSPQIIAELSAILNRKSINGFCDLCGVLDKIADKSPDKIVFYRDFAKNYLDAQKLKSLMDDYFVVFQNNLQKTRSDLLRILGSDFQALCEFLAAIKPYLEASNYDTYIELVNPDPLVKKTFNKALKNSELDDDLQKRVLDIVADLMDTINMPFTTDFRQDIAKLQENFAKISPITDFLVDVETAFLDRKRGLNSYTFSDIVRFTIQLLGIEYIQKEVQSQYDYIFIDEFQDTSTIQEAIIRRISNNNLFLVGDMKQSIYRFRNANVEIFKQYFVDYQAPDKGQVVTLDANFRSRQNLIQDINHIFTSAFSIPTGGLDYDHNHQMLSGNMILNSKTAANHQQQLIFLQGAERTNFSEPELIAIDIVRRVNAQEQVYDYRLKSLRNLTFKDISILIRRKNTFMDYVKVFSAYKIPLNPVFEEELGTSDVAYVLLNIFKVIAALTKTAASALNKREVVSIMRSFLFAIDDATIYDYVANGKFDKVKPVFSLLEDLAQASTHLNLEQLYIRVLRDFKVSECLISLGEINRNSQILESLFNLVSQATRNGTSLAEFVEQFTMFLHGPNKITFDTSLPTENAVNLCTIHASKGLQYKYVYLPDLGGRISDPDNLKGKVCFDEKYGLVSIFEESEAREKNVLLKAARTLERNESKNEALRLLYVALTRAEEKAILVNGYDPGIVFKATSDLQSFRDYISFSVKSLPEFVTQRLNTIKATEELLTTPLSDSLDVPLTDFSFCIEPVVADARRRPSKVSINFVNHESLNRGITLHGYLEVIDLISQDTSFINNAADRLTIQRFLKLPLFADLKKAEYILKEYQFFDPHQQVQGVIDLLVVYPTHLEIIDYKLKHLDDAQYVDQLHAYRDYLKTIDSRPIRMYLASIIDANLKEIT